MNSRDRKVMRLRKKGFEVNEIAEVVGISVSAVNGAISRGIQSINDTYTVDSVKAMEVTRLEQLHKTYFPDAVKGDGDAAKMVLGVHDRTAKMFGLHKEGLDATLTVGLVGVLASLSGRPNPLGDGAIEHSALEEGPGSIREGVSGSGAGSLASGEPPDSGQLQLPFDPVGSRGGQVSAPQLGDSVVDDVLLPSESGMHSAEQSPDVRRAVGGAGDVAPEDARRFTVRFPVKS